MGFRAPYLRYDDLRQHAEAFLAKYHPTRSIPVPIEFIVEASLGIDIVPVPGLQDVIESVAHLTRDMKEILVDERVYLKVPNRYRFSLAHEIGHLILHSEIIKQLKFDNIKEWKNIIANEIPEDQYSFLEFHAYAFAGLILVPSDKLKEVFFDYVEKAQQHEINFDELGTGARETAEYHIAKFFEVSSDVIHKRIEYDSLWHK